MIGINYFMVYFTPLKLDFYDFMNQIFIKLIKTELQIFFL